MAEERLKSHLQEALLAWYDQHRRKLPWRAASGQKPDPYHVWISEIMLQQTTVATVHNYYDRFLQRWPTIAALAAADQEEVLQAWSGLGYYSRARNLHNCAKEVVKNWGGHFPRTEAELLSLPGIGPYTAGAIAAIAFDAPHAAVDGNVERVISRLYALTTPLPAVKPEIRKRTQALVPKKRAGDFAQSLMDLGATICTPKNPNCLICPWTDQCLARQKGLSNLLPYRAKKEKIPTRRGLAYIIQREDGYLLLRKRPETGLLANMLEVPSSDWGEKQPDEPNPPLKLKGQRLKGQVEHTFTHFHLELGVWKAWVPADTVLPEGLGYRWVKVVELDQQALPTVMRKVIAFALRELALRNKP